MILQQELAFLASAACVGAGILLLFFGKERLETEKEEAYVEAVAYLADAVENGEEEQRIEEMYDAARQMKPERLEAYFQKALYYYEAREYETDIEYIENTILPSADFFEQEMMDDVYFILGNCYFELEKYEKAVTYYRTAVSRNDENPEYYRDYVISLVRMGEISAAEESLAEAETKEISSVDLLLMKGELKRASGDYMGAEQDLLQCIQETDNDYLKMRAYVICDMVYKEAGNASGQGADGEKDTEYLLKSRNLLEEARTNVGMENRLLIYERLAQTYIDLQELTADNSYGENAVSILQDVIAQGWGSYLTYNNIAILYQKMGYLEAAEETLNRMLEMDAENYNTYKRLAFLELEKQNQKENAERKYEEFARYYEKTGELYENRNSAGDDVEMQLLNDFYRQLEEGGWLK